MLDCAAFAGGAGSGFDSFGWTEVAPHYVAAHMSSAPGVTTIINQDKWDALPSDAQDLILDGFAKFSVAETRNYIQGISEFPAFIEEHNGTFSVPEDVNAALDKHQEEARANLVDNAPAGIGDAQGLVDQYLDLLEKWEGDLAGSISADSWEGLDGDALKEAYRGAMDAVDFDVYEELFQKNVIEGRG